MFKIFGDRKSSQILQVFPVDYSLLLTRNNTDLHAIGLEEVYESERTTEVLESPQTGHGYRRYKQ